MRHPTLLFALLLAGCAHLHEEWVAKCGPGNDPALMPCSCNNRETPDCYPPLNDDQNPISGASLAARQAAQRRYEARAAGYLPCEKIAAGACYDRAGIIRSAAPPLPGR